MIEFGPSDCTIEENIFEIPGYFYSFGARILVPEEIDQQQGRLVIRDIREKFAELTERYDVLIFPQLHSIGKDGFESIGHPDDPSRNDQPFQRLHKDYDAQNSSAFRLNYKRSGFATIYVPEPIALDYQVPMMLLMEECFDRDNIDPAIPGMYQQVISRRLGVLLNQDPGLTIISNQNGYHARIKTGEGTDMQLDLHHKYISG